MPIHMVHCKRHRMCVCSFGINSRHKRPFNVVDILVAHIGILADSCLPVRAARQNEVLFGVGDCLGSERDIAQLMT